MSKFIIPLKARMLSFDGICNNSTIETGNDNDDYN